MSKIKFTIITLFRDAIEPYLKSSMMEKATRKGIAEFDFVNLRDFGLGPHKSVDDTPYGGGDGMLLRPEPVFAAIESVKSLDPTAKVILPTPVGTSWNQLIAQKLAGNALLNNLAPQQSLEDTPTYSQEHTDNTIDSKINSKSTKNHEPSTKNLPAPIHYIILCPHYEGYDERILSLVDYKISLGNYILTGGELPALIIIDSIVRLIPGVLGGENSAIIESFSDGETLEYPQYTKPADFRGMKVPEILLSGNHGAIDQWRNANRPKKPDSAL